MHTVAEDVIGLCLLLEGAEVLEEFEAGFGHAELGFDRDVLAAEFLLETGEQSISTFGDENLARDCGHLRIGVAAGFIAGGDGVSEPHGKLIVHGIGLLAGVEEDIAREDTAVAQSFLELERELLAAGTG